MFYRLFAAMALVLVGCSSAVFAGTAVRATTLRVPLHGRSSWGTFPDARPRFPPRTSPSSTGPPSRSGFPTALRSCPMKASSWARCCGGPGSTSRTRRRTTAAWRPRCDRPMSSSRRPTATRSSSLVAEVDPSLGDRAILLASSRDGSLGGQRGPLSGHRAGEQVVRSLDSADYTDPRPPGIRFGLRPHADRGNRSGLSPRPCHAGRRKPPKPGLYLLGLGPGSPDLIAPRALRILCAADVVLCFSWMKDDLSPLTRPGTVEVASPLLMGGQYCGRKPEEVPPICGSKSPKPTKQPTNETQNPKALADGKTVAVADNGDATMSAPGTGSPWPTPICTPRSCLESTRSTRPTP